MTLWAGEPDSVVTANVVRVIAAASGPAATRARASTGASRPAPAMTGRSGSGRVRGHPAEQLDGGLGQPARHRGGVEAGDRPGQPRGRPAPGGCRGVAAAALDRQLERRGALLGHPDHADRRGHAGERVVGDRAALVEHEPRPHAAGPQLGDRVGGAGAGDLLGAPERQPHVLRGHEPAAQQRLDGLADRDELALVVERAATPDRAVDEVAAERRVGPAGALVGDGHDVEVGHQHHRALRGPTGPVREQPVPRDRDVLEPVQERVAARELGPERREHLVVDLVGVRVRDRRDPDQGLQCGHGARGVAGGGARGRRGSLPERHARHPRAATVSRGP